MLKISLPKTLAVTGRWSWKPFKGLFGGSLLQPCKDWLMRRSGSPLLPLALASHRDALLGTATLQTCGQIDLWGLSF